MVDITSREAWFKHPDYENVYVARDDVDYANLDVTVKCDAFPFGEYLCCMLTFEKDGRFVPKYLIYDKDGIEAANIAFEIDKDYMYNYTPINRGGTFYLGHKM